MYILLVTSVLQGVFWWDGNKNGIGIYFNPSSFYFYQHLIVLCGHVLHGKRVLFVSYVLCGYPVFEKRALLISDVLCGCTVNGNVHYS